MKFFEKLIDKAVEKHLKFKLITTKVARDVDFLIITVGDKKYPANRSDVDYVAKILHNLFPEIKSIVKGNHMKIKPCKRRKK